MGSQLFPLDLLFLLQAFNLFHFVLTFSWKSSEIQKIEVVFCDRVLYLKCPEIQYGGQVGCAAKFLLCSEYAV